MRVAYLAMIIALACGSAPAQSQRPGREKPAIDRAIEALVVEAQQAKKSQRLSRVEADFSSTFREDLPSESLLEALTQPVSKDAFVDAYVRWQLTSFNPPMPELDERQMIRLMANAPAMVPNPCADADTVATFERAEDAAQINERDRERLREVWQGLADRRLVAETFNAPAIQWRAWIDNQLPPRGPHKILWQIERVAATVNAGWDARNVKGDLTRLSRDLGRSVGELALTSAQISLVCEQIARMKGLRRRMIEDVAFLANSRVDVSFYNIYVSDNDIEKWIESLGGTVRR